MDIIVLKTTNYRISKHYISGKIRFFLDRVNGLDISNITNGSYDECLKELENQRQIDSAKEELIKIWRT